MENNASCHSHQDVSLLHELICHLPYAIFSVCFGLILLSFLSIFGGIKSNGCHQGLNTLFHSFHFLHIIFAATGSLVTFSRFSNNRLKGFIVSCISALIFCTLSDVILPYCGGIILGAPLHLHLCIFDEMHNIVPFLLVGLLNGLIMSGHAHETKGMYSVFAHFGHIFTSSLASLFFLVAEGFTHWYDQMGLLFLLLIVVVVIPCTFADVIVPVYFARSGKVNERYPSGKC